MEEPINLMELMRIRRAFGGSWRIVKHIQVRPARCIACVVMTAIAVARKPSTDANHALCSLCGSATIGSCNSFFRKIDYACLRCSHRWARALTAKERWSILHETNVVLGVGKTIT